MTTINTMTSGIDRLNFDKIATHPLQTWAWGEFRQTWGNEVVRFPFGQITLHKLPLTNFKVGVFEKGPAPNINMLNILKKYAQKNRVLFIRLEPNIEKDQNTIKLLRKNGCVLGRRIFTPSTFVIDLTRSEDELLKNFSPKTRYNIRVAQKNGVKVTEDNSDLAFKKYLELTQITARRQGFYAHNARYHKLMWQILKPAKIAHMLTATYNHEIITTWILFTWKDTLYYPYGASSEKYKNVMANNLAMWEAIRLGKSLGLKKFDLWGREKGRGFTKFKEGYSPKVVEFVGTWDFVVYPTAYYLYRIMETFRWLFLKTKAKLL